jgi:hypothetical protein
VKYAPATTTAVTAKENTTRIATCRALKSWLKWLLIEPSPRGRPFRTFRYFNLAVMYMCQHLLKVPHVDIRAADRAISEMIGLGFRDTVSINAGPHRYCSTARSRPIFANIIGPRSSAASISI